MVRNAHKILVMLSSPIAIKGALCSGPPLQHILVGKLARRNKQARGQIPSSPAPWLLSARQLKKKKSRLELVIQILHNFTPRGLCNE